MKTKFGPFCILILLTLVCARSSAQYSIDWFEVSGGSSTSTGSSYSLTATIGQFGTDTLTGGGYTLEGGFGGVSADAQDLVTLFDNTTGSENGVQAATTTSWLAGKLCLGVQSYGLESVTLLLSSQAFLGTPQPSTVRLQMYTDDPVGGIPSISTGVTMTLSGAPNPITLPLGTEDVRVKWIPAAPFTLAANTCYWVVLSVDDGVSVSETASVTMPTGAAATYGRAASIDSGATWLNADNSSNLKMLVEGNAISPAALVISAFRTIGNTLHFSFPTSIGPSYVIESRTELASGVWAEVPGTLQMGTGAALEASLPISPSQSQQFFRVKQLP